MENLVFFDNLLSELVSPEVPAMARLKITICMGSSCFSRGNSRNLEVLRDYVRSHALENRVEIEGALCEGQCRTGPHVNIDGQLYGQVDPSMLVGLLNSKFGSTTEQREETDELS
jgi:NADH:ubiquinone oxidoreductase subunit E